MTFPESQCPVPISIVANYAGVTRRILGDKLAELLAKLLIMHPCLIGGVSHKATEISDRGVEMHSGKINTFL
ncbi:hypothetical protein NQ315_001592 [Exocentrus adspersus]|uniref:Uncharacterized protein n=1 Tax=Exocentrus adspersus TaxID=1586481 RepID=A0AAV8W975_9CUCU|nr:hypothetical protein NQ315_001592 [Exocentrus adspersus]